MFHRVSSLSRVDRARARLPRRILACFLTTFFIAGGIAPAGSSEEPSETHAETEAAAPASGRTEVVNERTLTSRTYRNPDGSLEMDIYPGPIHYEAPDGSLEMIDNTLIPSDRPGYAFENAANAYKVFIPRDLDEKPVRIEIGEEWVSYSLEGASGEPVVEGDRVTFPDALDGIDLSYTVLNAGVEEDLILESPETPPSYSFDLAVSSGVQMSERQDESIVFKDPVSEERFSFAPPVMYEESSENDVSSAVSLDITGKGSDLSVELDPRDRWLNSPQRDYPVVVDPTWTYNDDLYADDCWIGNATASEKETSNCGGEQIRTGYFSQDSAKRRSLVEFQLDQRLSTDLTVSDATLRLCVTETLANNHTAVAVKAHRVTESWANASWNKRKPGSGLAWATPGGTFNDDPTDSNLSVGGSINKYEYWHPVGAVQRWMEGSQPNYGFLLKTSETQNQVVRFASFDYPNTGSPYGSASNCNSGVRPRAPKLTIEFNYRPGVPTALTPNAGTFTNDSTPTLGGTYNDVEQSDDGYMEFEVQQGGSVVRSGRSPGTGTVLPGSSVSWTPSTALTTEGAYEWRARNCDGQICSAWSSLRGLTFDITPPTPPVIQAGPDDPSPDATPAWDFQDEDDIDMQAGTIFECQLTKGGLTISAYSTCTAPITFDVSTYGVGTYTFSARERDVAGNVSAVSTDSYLYDPSVPVKPSIDSTPDDPLSDATAIFSFSGDTGAAFQCQLEHETGVVSAFASCSSPRSYDFSTLPEGPYTFSVRQTTGSGTSAPATYELIYSPGANVSTDAEDVSSSTAEDELDTFLDGAEALLGSRYGDFWVDYEASGEILVSVGAVNLATQDSADLEALETSSLTVTPVSVTYSDDELSSFADTIIEEASPDSIATIMRAPELNRLEVSYLDESNPSNPGSPSIAGAAWNVPSDAFSIVPDPYPNVETVEARSFYPPYRAGKAIHINHPADPDPCTSAFTMVIQGGVGVPENLQDKKQGLSAGHCGSNGDDVRSSWNLSDRGRRGTHIGRVRRDQVFVGQDDVQVDALLFGMDQDNWTATIQDINSITRKVTDTIPTGRLGGGRRICVFGNRTGRHCDGRMKKVEHRNIAGRDYYDLIMLRNVGCKGGDSGGPAYRRTYSNDRTPEYHASAAGVIVGGGRYHDVCFFEPIKEVENATNSRVKLAN